MIIMVRDRPSPIKYMQGRNGGVMAGRQLRNRDYRIIIFLVFFFLLCHSGITSSAYLCDIQLLDNSDQLAKAHQLFKMSDLDIHEFNIVSYLEYNENATYINVVANYNGIPICDKTFDLLFKRQDKEYSYVEPDSLRHLREKLSMITLVTTPAITKAQVAEMYSRQFRTITQYGITGKPFRTSGPSCTQHPEQLQIRLIYYLSSETNFALELAWDVQCRPEFESGGLGAKNIRAYLSAITGKLLRRDVITNWVS
jgi:hypothetical protein